MFTATQSSNLLRWLRRVIVVILIIANLATVMLAGAAPAQQDAQPLQILFNRAIMNRHICQTAFISVVCEQLTAIERRNLTKRLQVH